MIKTKKHSIIGVIGLLTISITTAVACNNNTKLSNVRADDLEYTLTLDSSNAISSTYSSTTTKVNKTQLGADVTFTYSNVTSASNSHTKLNSDGYILNKDRITSIKSFTASFSGNLAIRTSYDGTNFGVYQEITSNETYSFASQPYFLEIKSTGVTTLTSATYTYSCKANETGENASGEQLLGVIDFWNSSDVTNTDSGDEVTTSYVTSRSYTNDSDKVSKSLVSSVSGSKAYQKRYGGIGLSSNKSSGYLDITFVSTIRPNKVVIYAASAGGSALKVNNASKSVAFTRKGDSNDLTNCSQLTYTTTSTYSEIDIDAVGKIAIYRIYLYTSGGDPVLPKDEIGFEASDSYKSDYLVGDVYSATNGLSVSALYSDGTKVSLTSTQYTYVIKDSNSQVVDNTSAFTTAGTYTLTVSYKTYIPQNITLTVSEVPVLTIAAIELSKTTTTYNVGDTISLTDLTVYILMSDGTTEYDNVPYSQFTEYGITLALTNPSGVTKSLTSAFDVSGSWSLYAELSEDSSVNDSLSITVSEKSSGDTWNLLTDISKLTDGTLVVFACNTKSVVAGDISSSVMESLDATFSTDKKTITKIDEEAMVMTVKKSSSYYTFANGDNDLLGATGAKKLAWGSGTTTWSVSVTSGGVATIQNSNSGYGAMYYNAGAPRFTTYTAAQTSIQIYYQEVNTDPIYPTAISLGSNISVAVGETKTMSVTYTPSNTNKKEVTLSCNSNGIIVSGMTVKGNIEGTYTLNAASNYDANVNTSIQVTVTAAPALSKTNLTKTYDDYVYNNVYDLDNAPNTGNPKLLIIPVWFTDSSTYIPTASKSTVRDDIEKAYLGTNEETGWRSVKTFYEEESFGNVHLNGVVTDWYECGKASSYFYSDGDTTTALVTSAVNWYKTKSGDSTLKSFDTDGNGHLDGVMLIYGSPNCSSMDNDDADNMWAYCYWLQGEDANTSKPTPNVFFWASYDFMYDSSNPKVGNYGYGDTSNCNIDAHTFAHEMGHVFGLEDYYDYSSQYKPAGASTMQDYNVGGHDPYSRMALGWCDPYIPTTSTTIEINSFESSGDLVLLSPSFNSYASPFDEYILIELYTPTGVNQMDAENKYYGCPQLPTSYGIRIWHVDARLLYTSGSSFSASKVTTNPSISSYSVYHMMSNTYYKSGDSSTDYCSPLGSSYADYNILQYIRKSTSATYKPSDSISTSNMFKAGDTFSMSTYKSQFKNSGKLNSNIDLGFSVYFESVTASKAKLVITKA